MIGEDSGVPSVRTTPRPQEASGSWRIRHCGRMLGGVVELSD